MKILVADDHSLFRKAFINLLQQSFPNTEFLEATNGLEAVEKVERGGIDIVLLDIQMPVMNGIHALKKIKVIAPATRVIILTQFSDQSLIAHCLQAGACSFLLKNSNPDIIELAINRVQSEGSYFSPMVTEILQQLLTQSTGFANLDISPRELQVLAHLAQGYKSELIAEKLDLSVHTVRKFRTSLLSKTKTANVAELIALAHRTGILTTEQEEKLITPPALHFIRTQHR